ncbi:MAG: OmpA family protein [Methylobacterium sp.]|nr:OmpA family protein [Methylobacterium sp.]
MSSPIRWFFGLVPVFALLIAAGSTRQSGVEADLRQRGEFALKAATLDWASVTLAGRDAILQGEAPAPEALPAALATAGQVAGIRLVRNAMTLLPEQNPFTTEISRDRDRVVLAGFIPPGPFRNLVTEATRKAFPGLPIDDQMKAARGASAHFLHHLEFGLAQLSRLAQGQLSLADETLSLTGHAANVEIHDAVRAGLEALPAGLVLGRGLGRGDITSPAIRPYLFNAVRGERNLTLIGFVPDSKAREDILDLARRYFEGDHVVETLQIGLGAPAGFLAAVQGGLQELSRLMPGASLAMSDQTIALRGLAPLEPARDQVLAGFRARMPASFGITLDINTASPPPPIRVVGECNFLFRDLLSRARIQFDTGSSAIAPESLGLLDRLAVAVRRCEGAKIEIAGHTDSVGSTESNFALSEARARSVVDHLAKSGIVGERIEARGYGSGRPIASNETAEGRAQNRRIEFSVQ